MKDTTNPNRWARIEAEPILLVEVGRDSGNWVSLPYPEPYNLASNTLDSENSGRNQEGYNAREVIRYDINVFDISWTGLDEQEYCRIRNAVQQHSKSVRIKLYLAYGDGGTQGGLVEYDCYVSNVKASCIKISTRKLTGGKNRSRWSYSCTFTQN